MGCYQGDEIGEREFDLNLHLVIWVLRWPYVLAVVLKQIRYELSLFISTDWRKKKKERESMNKLNFYYSSVEYWIPIGQKMSIHFLTSDNIEAPDLIFLMSSFEYIIVSIVTTCAGTYEGYGKHFTFFAEVFCKEMFSLHLHKESPEAGAQERTLDGSFIVSWFFFFF